MPFLQSPSFAINFISRTSSAPDTFASSVRAAVESVDKNQPLSQLATMDGIVAKSIAPQRFRMLLLGLFALLAFVLATIGTYSVISYGVEHRAHEIGVRTALGATRPDILALIVGQGLRVALLGVLVGIAGALALTRFLANMLFGVAATDPLTFVAVSALIVTAALLACYLPARRAANVDPMFTLRAE